MQQYKSIQKWENVLMISTPDLTQIYIQPYTDGKTATDIKWRKGPSFSVANSPSAIYFATTVIYRFGRKLLKTSACRWNWCGNNESVRNFTHAIGQSKHTQREGQELCIRYKPTRATMKLTLSWVDVFHLNAIKATLASLGKHTRAGRVGWLVQNYKYSKMFASLVPIIFFFLSDPSSIALQFIKHAHTYNT